MVDRLVAGTLEALVDDVALAVVQRARGHRLVEAHGETQLAPRRPAAGGATAGDRAVVRHLQLRPQHLAGVVVDAGAQVEQQVGGLVLRKGVAVPAHAATGGELGADAVVAQRHRVIAGLHHFAVVRETRAIAAAGFGRVAGFQPHLTGDRHHQHVAQVRMAGTGEMRVRETHDAGVAVPVAGGPLVGVLEVRHRGVGRELDHAERHRGAGEGVAIAAGADARVDIAGVADRGHHR